MQTTFDDLFRRIAEEIGVEWWVLKAIAVKESSLEPLATRFGHSENRHYREAYKRWQRTGSRWKDHKWADFGWILWRSYGLMQILYVTATEVGHPFEGDWLPLFAPEYNVQLGARHLKRLLDKYGNISSALSVYNAGRLDIRDGQFGNQRYVDAVMRTAEQIRDAPS